jgi:hypothetical protein
MRYARGVADGFIVARMLDETVSETRKTAPTSMICIPDLATSRQIVDVALSYWDTANQETRSLKVSQLLAEAWLKAWSCSKGRTQ